MVLGLRKKSRKGSSVQVDYLIHVQEIKPWPPSQSLRSVQSILLQWENGDQSSGSFTSCVGDGKVEFSETFRVPVTLHREASRKGTAHDRFQKNCLEFYLYEPRKDKAAKSQVLGSATINLADFGIIKESLAISAPVNFKRSFRNMAQPVLYANIQSEKDSCSSSPRSNLSKDKDGSESVSELVNEESAEESIASFTDDDADVSSHSSRTTLSSAFQTTRGSPSQIDKNKSEPIKDNTGRVNTTFVSPSIAVAASPEVYAAKYIKESSSSLLSAPTSLGNPINDSLAKVESLPPYSQEGVKTRTYLEGDKEAWRHDKKGQEEVVTSSLDVVPLKGNEKEQQKNTDGINIDNNLTNGEDDKKAWRGGKHGASEPPTGILHMHPRKVEERSDRKDFINISLHADGKARRNDKDDAGEGVSHNSCRQDDHISGVKKNISEEKSHSKVPQDSTQKQVKLRSNTLTFSKTTHGMQGGTRASNKLKNMKSVQLHYDSPEGDMFINSQLMEKADNNNVSRDDNGDCLNGSRVKRKEATNGFFDCKVELESKIETLEEELLEAAALEAGLYSVVAEHGSSTNKVHAPARRLSRFYLHACKASSQSKKASAARAAVSGLALVCKACGNDVPRLTFWLSNSIVLRAIVSQATGKLQLSSGTGIKGNGGGLQRFSPKLPKSPREKEKINSTESSDEWEDPQTFVVALEKFEAWIFSRIVESVWWQTLTPHMQSAAAKGSSSRKGSARRQALGNQEQGFFSAELWKKAFKDACERLCPVRAGGHECGCLPVLAKLVMEQLVRRLDVAMFNAILRESAEEMPTDPVSDPISDSNVLPVPAGKSSFGAGAQLKNAIGNWSRWLTDLFGIDDSDTPEEKDKVSDDKCTECGKSFKAFHLLNALSDLMMLPVEMLSNRSIRQEVCPMFSASLVKRVLYNFVPDEFNPNPIPEEIFETLDSEDQSEGNEESIGSFPCKASPTIYLPPPAAVIMSIVGEVATQTLSRNRSNSVLRKAYTSDDELDELDSPMTSIIADISRTSPSSVASHWMPKGDMGRKVVRYQLLREVWRHGEE